MKVILIVDDAPELRKVLSLYIKNGGYQPIEAEDGRAALEIVKEQRVDLAILDVMMPNMDGFELVQEIRKTSDLPILFLSARDQVADKIMGLTLGADDYLSKPFDPMEVLARVNALLRRAAPIVLQKTLGPLTWDEELGRIYLKGQELDLTGKEYEILSLLMGKPRKIFTKEEIYQRVWKEDYFGDDNVIMVHMSKIRDKMGSHKEMIRTIRGLGYCIEAQGEDEQK